MEDPGEAPDLSVCIVVGAERERAGRSLRCLLRQTALERMEILCVDLQPDAGAIPELGEPSVRTVTLREGRFMDRAMARALEEARAPLVAFIEDHGYAEPEWAASVIRAFERPEVALVNYSFTHGGAGTYLDRAFLVTEYGRWMAPTRAGEIPIASCNNIAYRVQALDPYRADMLEWLAVSPVLHLRIQKSGGVVWQEPAAVVAHEGWSSLWDGCWANGVFKRMFGASRVEHGRWRLPRRLVWALGMTLAPAVHLGRLAWSLRNRPRLWPTFVWSLPVATIVYVYSSFQEALGYLLGPGRSYEDFTRMELGLPRQR
jgi:hypothetical protein